MEDKTFTLPAEYNLLEGFLNRNHKELFNDPKTLFAIFEKIFNSETPSHYHVFKLYGIPRGKQKKAVITLEFDTFGELNREVGYMFTREFTESLKDAEKRNDDSLKLIYGTTL